MICHIYKPKRRKGGKLVVQRTYRGRYRLAGEFGLHDVPLDTTDKQVAHARLLALVQEKEREQAGLLSPKLERESAGKPTLDHLEDFVADLKALGRSAKYGKLLTTRIKRLVAECGFQHLHAFSSDAFTTWRSRQSELKPKTLNEYLNFANTFLNWLKRQVRTNTNPLALVVKVDLRGKQQKRRAITQEELPRLLAMAGERRLTYLTAIYTGLRVAELRQLVWADVHLDDSRPYLLARASTTKNKKEATIPLHPALADEIRRLPRKQGDEAKPVFRISKHMDRSFKRDLLRSGIEPLDAMRKKLDFHALRKTFATRLAQKGVPQRFTQELMRHSDPGLTANSYTDASQLPTFEAVASLDWEGHTEQADTHIASQNSGLSGQLMAQTDLTRQMKNPLQPVESKEDWPKLSPTDTLRQNERLVEPRGFEPLTPTMPLWCSTN
jgi:integrase